MNKKIAFVSGGSKGIGAAIAERLAVDGFHVVVGFCASGGLAKEVVRNIINNKSAFASAIAVDLGDRESIDRAFGEIFAEFGPVSVLVNNGAVSQEKPFLDITDADWDRMLKINLWGAFACIQNALPAMIDEQNGRIINVASIGGQWGGVNQIHYASAKAGLIGLTKSIAKTFTSSGITCNAISPGLVATEMSGAELETQAGQMKVKQIPAGRLGTREEMAGAVSYLAGPDGAYVTGQTINLNGGMYFG